MDNRSLDVTAEGNEDLELALRLAWRSDRNINVTHYKVVRLKEETSYYSNNSHTTKLQEVADDSGVITLILFSGHENGAKELPYPLNFDNAVPFINGWLQQAPYDEEPDHDGSNGKGWRVFTEKPWGHVAGFQSAVVAVQPAWAMYGK